jgi:hypothetical protein
MVVGTGGITRTGVADLLAHDGNGNLDASMGRATGRSPAASGSATASVHA